MFKFEKYLKLIIACTAGASMLTLSACSSQTAASSPSAATSQTQQVIECPYPDSPTIAAPTWICDEPLPGWQVSAVGSATLSNAGPSFDKEMAIAQARDALARSMRTQVKNMIKRFVRTTGTGDQGTVDAMHEVVSRHITKETLYGSRVIKSRTSPNGTIYVAVGLDTQRVVENARAAIKKARTSMKNSEAQYQILEADKSLQELDEKAPEIVAGLDPSPNGEE